MADDWKKGDDILKNANEKSEEYQKKLKELLDSDLSIENYEKIKKILDEDSKNRNDAIEKMEKLHKNQIDKED